MCVLQYFYLLQNLSKSEECFCLTLLGGPVGLCPDPLATSFGHGLTMALTRAASGTGKTVLPGSEFS